MNINFILCSIWKDQGIIDRLIKKYYFSLNRCWFFLIFLPVRLIHSFRFEKIICGARVTKERLHWFGNNGILFYFPKHKYLMSFVAFSNILEKFSRLPIYDSSWWEIHWMNCNQTKLNLPHKFWYIFCLSRTWNLKRILNLINSFSPKQIIDSRAHH